MKLLYDPQQKD